MAAARQPLPQQPAAAAKATKPTESQKQKAPGSRRGPFFLVWLSPEACRLLLSCQIRNRWPQRGRLASYAPLLVGSRPTRRIPAWSSVRRICGSNIRVCQWQNFSVSQPRAFRLRSAALSRSKPPGSRLSNTRSPDPGKLVIASAENFAEVHEWAFRACIRR
jgi:hypothetical protein